MFIWDFIMGDVMDQFIDWLYGQAVGFLGEFFSRMGGMGIELFEMGWVQSIILFFSYLAWALFVVGLVVSVFETGIEYQNGRNGIKGTALNAIKGYMAVSLFTLVPVELFKLSVSLQASLSAGITGYGTGYGEMANEIIKSLGAEPKLSEAVSTGVLGGLSTLTNPTMMFFVIVLMGYSVIKVFFANLKRGEILLIQIAVGSLYMFSVPRGYTDGFYQWCKQVIALCLTGFLQATILTAGLMVVRDNALLGLGLMLSAGEVPRIAGAFGLDTSTKASLSSAIYTMQSAVNTTKTVVRAVSPK